MGSGGKSVDASIRAFFSPTPCSTPAKIFRLPSSPPAPSGDGFTAEEIQGAIKPKEAEPWRPTVQHVEHSIEDLRPRQGPVTFTGRITNIHGLENPPKNAHQAKGCFKLYVQDDTGVIVVRLLFAHRRPNLRLGSLITIWTNNITIGENRMLSTAATPLFASLFPERIRTCNLEIHDDGDESLLCRVPLGYHAGHPLCGLITLQNSIDGGCEVVDSRVLVVVKSIGAKKSFIRKDGSVTETVNLQVYDNTTQATLGFWGIAASTPFAGSVDHGEHTGGDTCAVRQSWKAGETILLIQGPRWKIGSTKYLSLTSSSVVDVNPNIPEANWLRHWAQRQKSRETVNPPFPEGIFDLEAIKTGPSRCLYTVGDLDDFARAAPTATCQGYLSVIIIESKLDECWKRQMLFSGQCCDLPVYAGGTPKDCTACENMVDLRLNPCILGQVVDETAVIASGKLLLSDTAWQELLGHRPDEVMKLDRDEIKRISDRLLFCRVTLLFAWTGDESVAGGRICVLGVQA